MPRKKKYSSSLSGNLPDKIQATLCFGFFRAFIASKAIATRKPGENSLKHNRKHFHAVSAGSLRQLVFGAAILLNLSALHGPANAAGTRSLQLAVLPFEIEDNSGEAGSAEKHKPMLSAITNLVREKISTTGIYKPVPGARVDAAVKKADPGTYLRSCNGCELDIARSAGAEHVMIGWVFKVSSLVLALHVQIKDVKSGQLVYHRAFDYRGDNMKAWQRVVKYMIKSVNKELGGKEKQPTN